MDGYKTRVELKQDAKDMLSGNWGNAVLMYLVPTLLMLVIGIILIVLFFMVFDNTIGSSGGMQPTPGYYETTTNGNSGSGGGAAGGLISTMISTGISFTFLEALRRRTFRFEPLKNAFSAFRKPYVWQALLIYILSTIFTFLWALLLVIPGIIKSLAYSQAYFVMKDHKDYPELGELNALDSITESRRLMDGHKMRYFLLQLSFIGWGLVGIITLGIGFLWIGPYMLATNAAFYNDLVGEPSPSDVSFWDEQEPPHMERDFPIEDTPLSTDEEDDWEDLDF